MDNKYFSNFPLISYNKTNCLDITQRVAFLQSVYMNAYIYYPYDLVAYERADQFANRYYGDSYKSWLLYMSNNIMDPLRQWYLQDSDFKELINEKYGNVPAAAQKTKFYRNNWENSEHLTPSGYHSLPALLQPYWEPVTTGNRITSYKRIQVEWTVNTNRIVSYNVANSSFIRDEIVDITFNPDNTGRGQVLSINSNTNTLFIQHVSGIYIGSNSFLQTEDTDFLLSEDETYLMADADTFIYGRESQCNTSFEAPTLVAENLADAEEAYWTPVSYLDWENEGNEFNKTIRVLDKRYAGDAVSNLKDLLAIA